MAAWASSSLGRWVLDVVVSESSCWCRRARRRGRGRRGRVVVVVAVFVAPAHRSPPVGSDRTAAAGRPAPDGATRPRARCAGSARSVLRGRRHRCVLVVPPASNTPGAGDRRGWSCRPACRGADFVGADERSEEPAPPGAFVRRRARPSARGGAAAASRADGSTTHGAAGCLGFQSSFSGSLPAARARSTHGVWAWRRRRWSPSGSSSMCSESAGRWPLADRATVGRRLAVRGRTHLPP